MGYGGHRPAKGVDYIYSLERSPFHLFPLFGRPHNKSALAHDCESKIGRCAGMTYIRTYTMCAYIHVFRLFLA